MKEKLEKSLKVWIRGEGLLGICGTPVAIAKADNVAPRGV
jgi:hypothetical protein